MNKRVIMFGALALAVAGSANAGQHFMQIEQVVVNGGGDSTSQAVQLRMRAGGQNITSGTELIAFDAAGNNPVSLLTLGSNVASGNAGDRILVVSPNFASQMAITPDFTMTAVMPQSYFAAGKLIFERSNGDIIWSLCWGGASYTGTNTGETFNDADGDFGACFASALPQTSDQGLLFQGAAADLSTNNAADYAATVSAAVVTNNAGSSSTVPVELETFSVE